MNKSIINKGLIVLACLASSISGVAIYKYFEPVHPVIIKENYTAKYTNDSSSTPTLTHFPQSFADAAAIATPTVVYISCKNGIRRDNNGYYYGKSSGSGIIVSDDGYIVTNYHVIEKAEEMSVLLNDRRNFKAVLVGSDATTDIALLKIDAVNLPEIKFGNSDKIRVGDWVLAVGNPLKLESTVTAGIVSAKGRQINILNVQNPIESFIQTDAVVNSGNSGGALVNTQGELIGINTAIVTQTGSYEGYAFAVPSNLAIKIIEDLKSYGQVQRGLLGLEFSAPEDNQGLGMIISRVNPNSAGEAGGLKEGDIILSIDNKEIKSQPDMDEMLGRSRPGDRIDVSYFRNSKIYKTVITLRNQSNTTEIINIRTDDEFKELGFELRNLNINERIDYKTKGVVVLSVTQQSKAERANMLPGYIITEVNNKKISNADDLLTSFKASKKVLLKGFYPEHKGYYYYLLKR